MKCITIALLICITSALLGQSFIQGHSDIEYNSVYMPGLSIKNISNSIVNSSHLSIYNDINHRIDIGVRSSNNLLGANHPYISAWNNQPLDFATGLNETRMSIDSLGRVVMCGDDQLQDTIFRVKTDFTGNVDLVGLLVDINPAGPSANYGIGGIFKGGENGIRAISPNRWAVFGITETGIGIFGSSGQGGTGVHGFSGDGVGTVGVGRNSYGVQGTTQSGTSYGVKGLSTDDFGGGVHGSAISGTGVLGSSTSGYGVRGYSANTNGISGESGSSNHAGISGTSSLWGVYGHGSTAGVYGHSIYKYGVVGHSDAPNSLMGFDFYASGGAPDYGSSSSRRWKHNIHNIPNPLEMISQLRGVYYDWDQEHGAGRHDIGFIAEEVGAVIPEIVSYEENGIDAIAMDYTKLPALLVEAFNTLRSQYDAQHVTHEQQILLLMQRIEQLEKNTSSN